jgi:hypothetical protein
MCFPWRWVGITVVPSLIICLINCLENSLTTFIKYMTKTLTMYGKIWQHKPDAINRSYIMCLHNVQQQISSSPLALNCTANLMEFIWINGLIIHRCYKLFRYFPCNCIHYLLKCICQYFFLNGKIVICFTTTAVFMI